MVTKHVGLRNIYPKRLNFRVIFIGRVPRYHCLAVSDTVNKYFLDRIGLVLEGSEVSRHIVILKLPYLLRIHLQLLLSKLLLPNKLLLGILIHILKVGVILIFSLHHLIVLFATFSSFLIIFLRLTFRLLCSFFSHFVDSLPATNFLLLPLRLFRNCLLQVL